MLFFVCTCSCCVLCIVNLTRKATVFLAKMNTSGWMLRAIFRRHGRDHHHISVMDLGHLLTRSGLTYPEVSSKVCHDSFCQLGNSVSLPWVIYYEAFFLHVVSSFSCIPVICLKLVLFLIPLQFVYLFRNLSECVLLFFSCIASCMCINRKASVLLLL